MEKLRSWKKKILRSWKKKIITTTTKKEKQHQQDQTQQLL